MLSRPRIIAVAVLTLAVITAAGIQQHRIAQLKDENTALALQASNDTARQDTTVRVSAIDPKVAAAVGDSLALFKKLVVQQKQEKDALDRALGLERRGRYALGLQLDSLQRIASAVVSSDSADHVRRAHFDVRQAPYTVAAAVELPPAPDTARLALRVALDPIPVTARLSCAPPNSHGIRAASIEAQAPQWASLRFDNVEQSPDLCASPALTHATRRALVRFNPLVVGGGRVVLPDGTSRWGGFVGSGFAFFST